MDHRICGSREQDIQFHHLKNLASSFKIIDIFIIIMVLSVAVVSGVFIYGNRSGRVHLVIEAPGGSWIYSLDEERTVEIPGLLGNTIVMIQNGNVRIIKSPCPNQTCLASPPLSTKGEWNACLPNQVILRVEGDTQKDDVDAIAQ